MQNAKLLKEIENLQDQMVKSLVDLIQIPAIAPENGGNGEADKAQALLRILGEIGFDEVQSFDADDPRVPSKKRPNVIAQLKGQIDTEKLWIITHLDVVPPGEESLWTTTRPFKPKIKDGKIYGRGSEDNTQETVSSIYAAKALKNLGLKPKRTLALCFVADEEQGSKLGIQYLIKKGLFRKQDLVVVPDGGSEDGAFIEVAEKSSLWLRIRTAGKQTHASRPGAGLNAHRVAMEYALALDRMLHEKYRAKDDCFDPPESTFEPTKKEKNVDAVNIVPGEDITYFDCRILPEYSVDEVMMNTEKLAREFERKTGAKIKIETVNKNIAARPTSKESRIVRMISEALRNQRKLKPRVGGIGGGTCAAFFREIGIPAVVWSTVDEMAHQPDEYARIQNMVNDAKIFAILATAS